MNSLHSAVIVNFLNKMSTLNQPALQKISIVVPVFNEIGIIKAFHNELVSCLRALKQPFEIIYIDDNSEDGTFSWLIKKAHKNVERRTSSFTPTNTNTTAGEKATAYKKYKKQKGEMFVFKKEGKKGKAFSLIQGFEKATGDILVMIDGDLQYPPSTIKGMIEQLRNKDIVIADRHYKKDNSIRSIFSKSFRFFFGNTLFGIHSDIQSGLKAFKREVIKTVNFTPFSAWSFDLEFLYRAVHAGYKIQNYPINFAPRTGGISKLNLLNSTIELGMHALLLRLKKLSPFSITPINKSSMRWAGIGYNKRRYITHTTLSYRKSALQTFIFYQTILVIGIILAAVWGLNTAPLTELHILVAILSIVYFIDSLFNFFLVLNSLKRPVEIKINERKLSYLDDSQLPVYTILCPLYKEVRMIPQFIEAIADLDWPKNKLDVILLFEEDDKETIDEIHKISLPYYFRNIIVPESLPKTKPKACNYGLTFAKGEYLVIYDAEDIPDPKQLKKVYLGFQDLPSNVRCLQAKLNFYNPRQNLLTKFFTAEYSLWFDLTLTGLQSLYSGIPLGGTSNHFRTQTLRELEGWDPFNVTEDADLGIRLFRRGYKTAIIDSNTMEEANSNLSNWLRQRSRWIKGYMQTYLVHMRDFKHFITNNGLKHALIFQLIIGGKLLFLIINPLMWLITFLYFAFHSQFSNFLENVFYPPVLYFAVASLVFGNFLFLYNYMLACGKRNQWGLVKYIYLVPIYWVMMSYASLIAAYQLVFSPHYWEKTIHGLHLGRGIEKQTTEKEKVRPSISFGYSFKTIMLSFYYILFFTADLILIRSLYAPDIFSQYLNLSIIGKSIFLGGQIFGFIIYSFLKRKNVQKKEKREISFLIFSTFLASWAGVILFGFQIASFFPGINSEMLSTINYLLPSFTIAMTCFAMSNILILFNLKKKVNTFLIVAYLAQVLQLYVIFYTHADLSRLVQMTVFLAGANVLLMFLLHLNKDYIRVFENNLSGLFRLLDNRSIQKSWEENNMNILIFNWRDIKHIYSGGAEVYIQELAKRWVKQGNKVTIFCGNDNKNPINEVVDGIEIIRCGGTYTVYFFAFIYYIFKFAGKYDLIIDCENGIPFFTPLYVRKPIILVIHHVHQDIIRKYLRFPINLIVSFLEAKFMPLLYRNKKIITVSESSKEEIIKLGFTHQNDIEIIYNGAAVDSRIVTLKTSFPSFLYLGRLQEYKNIDVAIIAFSLLVRKYKSARFRIAGYGESQSKLRKLVKFLKIEDNVEFLNRVSDLKKTKLFSESWAMVQPSQVEGWGLTVIEANACGTPVIASRVNGLRDSVLDGKTGILAECNNVEQFVDAMEKMILDTQYRNKLSREAFIWSKNFTWSKSAENFYNLIGKSITKNIINTKGSSEYKVSV